MSARFKESDVGLYASAATIAAFGLTGVHVCDDECNLQPPYPLRVWICSSSDTAIAERTAALIKLQPMVFIAYLHDGTAPGIDFYISVSDVSTLPARVMSSVYAPELFCFKLKPHLRKVHVCSVAEHAHCFGPCVEWLRLQCVRAGLELCDATDESDDIVDLYIGWSKMYPVNKRPYVLFLVEQILCGRDQYDTAVFRDALHVVVPSHVILRAIRPFVPRERISILPHLWATGMQTPLLNAPKTRCIQLGDSNARRWHVHNQLISVLPSAEYLMRLWYDAKAAVLKTTRVLYCANYYTDPAFVTMHRIAECLAFGIHVVAERTCDVIMQRAIEATTPVVFCEYKDIVPQTVAAMNSLPFERPAILDQVLNTALDTCWFPA